MTGRQHSIVPHKTNYFFIPLEDDYLAMYEDMAQALDPIKEANKEKLSGPSDCKGMIASVLEAWMNSKRPTAKCDDDLYIYLTYDEWEQALRYRYKRSTIIQCLKEMEAEGEYLDETGKHGEPMTLYKGTVKKRHFVQNTFEYQLNLPVILALLEQLPEQSPFEQKSRPSLGRPRKNRINKNHSEINGLNKNGLNLDDRDVKIDDGSVKTNDSRPKINVPFYTQITHTKQTYTEGTEASANASPAPAPDASDVIIPGHEYSAAHLDANCAEWRAVNQHKTCQDYQAAINAARLATARTITLAGMRPAPSQDEPYRPDFSASQEQQGDINGHHADSDHSSSRGDTVPREHDAGTRDRQEHGQDTTQAVASQSLPAQASAEVETREKRTRAPRAPKAAPVVPEFSVNGRKVYDAWCTNFKSPPRVGPKTVECADALYPLLVPWCKELHVSCAVLLDEIQKHLYKTDTSGFYKRGVTLCDIDRDFEKWQSAKTQELAELALKAAPKQKEPSAIELLRAQQQRYAPQGGAAHA